MLTEKLDHYTAAPTMFLHRINNLLAQPPDLAFIPAFEHDAQERLGAGISHQQPAVASQVRLDALDDGGHAGNRLEIDLLLHAQVHEDLRVRRQIRCQLSERPPRRRHRAQHVERRGEAITGEQVFRKDDMARLLAAKHKPLAHHLFHDVLVADLASHEPDTGLAEGDLQTDVAHHRRHDGVALQAAFGLHLLRTHQHHGIAVDDASLCVDEDRPVAVAVVGDANVVLSGDNGLAPAVPAPSIRSPG